MINRPSALRSVLFCLAISSVAAGACTPSETVASRTGGGPASGGRAGTGGSTGSGGTGTIGSGGAIGSGGRALFTGGASGTGASVASGGALGGGGGATLGSGGTGNGAASGGSGASGLGGGATGGSPGTGGTGGGATGGAAGGAPSGTASVVTNRYDNGRSGTNLQESILTTSNVNQTRFGLQFSRTVDGQMYAQPLYLSGLTMPDNKVHNVVFAATQHNTVYAFDADSVAATAPLWSRNLGPSGGVSVYTCTDMLSEVGITSTPTIDAATGTMFVVAKGLEGGAWVQRLHALDVRTGLEKPGSPVVITGSVSGTGDGSSGGTLTFNSKTQLNRPGLLFQNGMVYIAFASHCDDNPYHGWVLAYSYDGAALVQKHAFVTSPNGNRGGIWQSGIGISADASNLYLVVGNGSTNPNANPQDLSESVVRLGISDFLVKDYWTPTAFAALTAADSDLSSGAILLPHNLLITGSKDGRIYVIDSTNMGKYSASGDGIIQTLTTPGKASGQRGHLHGGAIYYNSGGTEWVYLWPEETQLIGYKIDPATRKLQNLVQASIFSPGHPGGFLTLSSNAGAPGSGILWGSVPQMDAWHVTAPGTVYAVDATDISKVLWSSEQNATRDRVGNFAKTVPPVVANGHVYVATFSNALKVYGLLN